MAGTLHEFVVEGCKDIVKDQLNGIRRGNDKVAADFAREVQSRGSPKIEGLPGGSHHPDGSFGYKDALPSCILEVSYSQKRRDLPLLADEYIQGSNGRTQVVIGIDLEYKGKEARVILWRPRFSEENGEVAIEAAKTESGIFRAADGSLVNGERILRIRLKDFGYWPKCRNIDDIHGEITIPFSQLYELVQKGEACVAGEDAERRQIQQESYRRPKRARSPPEQLEESDEKRFKAMEEEVEKQLSDLDEDYMPSDQD